MDEINVLLSVIILINLMLVVISSSSHRNHADKGFVYSVYLFNIVTIVWWVGSMMLNRISDNQTILGITKYLYVSATTIASSFYYFGLIFPDSNKKYLKELIGLIILNIFVAALVIFGHGIIDSAHKDLADEVSIHFGRYYFIYIAYIIILFTVSFVRLFLKYRRLGREDQKWQTFWLFLGYTTSGIFCFISDVLIPSMGSSGYCWVGPVSAIFMATSVTYAVKRHHLFNIKILSGEIFVFILWVFALLKISVFEKTDKASIFINILFFLISIIVGLLLIKSLKKQVERHEENIILVGELAAANSQLKEVDEIKSKFVSLARHHMASPLTAITAYSSLLNDKDLDPAKVDLKSLQGIIDRFILIVRDFLAISQIENGEVVYSKDTVNIKGIIHEVLSEKKFILEHKNIDVDLNMEHESECCIKGDRKKITTAISNVLENSIQYSNESSIQINLGKDGSKTVLTIRDQGIRSLPLVSNVLVKKLSSNNDTFEASLMGNGLGVYVAKKLIEAHGGEFQIKHDNGCEFRVSFI